MQSLGVFRIGLAIGAVGLGAVPLGRGSPVGAGAPVVGPGVVELRPTRTLAAAGPVQFREPGAFARDEAGTWYVFDRRHQAVFALNPDLTFRARLVNIGGEPGRVLQPSLFSLAPDGSFAVADAPNAIERIQVFGANGVRNFGFTLEPGAAPLKIGVTAITGVNSLSFDGHAILINNPASGALVSEYDRVGRPQRAFGILRTYGDRRDPEVGLAANRGLIATTSDRVLFVLSTGVPLFRAYDRGARLLFERHIEGPELDAFIQSLPSRWTTGASSNVVRLERKPAEHVGQKVAPRDPEVRLKPDTTYESEGTRPTGGELPVMPPAVQAAALDPRGNLWVALTVGFVYVYDSTGEKLHTVRLWDDGGWPVVPTSLFITPDGRLLVTDPCRIYSIPF